jgi:hypothetical protein
MNKQRNEIGDLIDVALEVFETSGNLLIQLKNLATALKTMRKRRQNNQNNNEQRQFLSGSHH